MCVLGMSGCHAGCAYVMTGLMYCLYVCVMSSLEWQYVLWVRARSTFRRVLALVFTLEMCSPKVNPLSKVSPRIVGVGVCGIGVLLSLTMGCMLYSLFQGVIRVSVDLVGETLSLLLLSHCSSVLMYS